MYESLIGNLSTYPIPDISLPHGRGEFLLDVGCNWGRWTIAAAKRGYRAVGMDPNPEAVLAARRVARQLGVEALFVVGDARYLPFQADTFDVVYSYSVLQHLPKSEAKAGIAAAGRVLKKGGLCKIEMPNAVGLRCLYHQTRRGFREARDFEVRYWTPGELKATFAKLVGPSRLEVDGYFSINPQTTDLPALPWKFRALVRASEFLRKLSRKLPWLSLMADSLFACATKI
jgi:SAM-dependent methyltransferase